MTSDQEIILKAKIITLSMIERREAYYRKQGVRPPAANNAFGFNDYLFYKKLLRILNDEPPLCKNCKRSKADHDELGGVRICSTVTYVADDAE